MSSSTATFKIVRKKDFRISLSVAILALIVGTIGLFQMFVMHNHGALTSYVPWGLLVGAYIYMIWIEVGTILAFIILFYGMKMKSLEKLTPVVLIAAISALAAAMTLVGSKLGHPFRAWKVFLEPSFSSVMIWEIWTHILFIFLLLGMLYATIKNKDVLLKWLSYISVPIGIVFISLVGALFGVVAARPFWNVSVMPLMFFIASIVSGVALLTLIHLLFSPTKGTDAYKETAENLSRTFFGAISIGIIAALGNALIIAFPNVPAYNDALQLVLFGPYWWTTWIIHIGIGIVIPVILLFFFGKNLKAMGTAAVCYLIGFSMVPVNIIIPGLAYPMSGMEGIAEAFNHSKLSFKYTPALVEWLVVIFAVGLALFIFTLGYKYILQPYFERTLKNQ